MVLSRRCVGRETANGIRGLDRCWHRCIASNRKIDRRVSLETKSRAGRRRYFIGVGSPRSKTKPRTLFERPRTMNYVISRGFEERNDPMINLSET